MHVIRLRVRENQLSDPSVVTEQDYHDFLARDTMSWVCEMDGEITGFVMVDVESTSLAKAHVFPIRAKPESGEDRRRKAAASWGRKRAGGRLSLIHI